MEILNQYIKNGNVLVTEYTKDGVTINNVVEQLINTDTPQEPTTPQLYIPTNAEIAQMISDLQADLVIAGVI